MFSRLKHQLTVFAPLGAGLLIITLLTALGGLWQYQSELGNQSAKTPAGIAEAATLQKDASTAGSDSLLRPGTTGKPGGNSPSPTGSNISSYGNMPATKQGKTPPASGNVSSGRTTSISLVLSINGQAKGTVGLAAGSSQCDVLSQAKAEGVISSLDMRYSSQYGTEAVYVINGIGDPDSVWWTYKVNGIAPPYGCAYVTARAGDSVNWQYVKG